MTKPWQIWLVLIANIAAGARWVRIAVPPSAKDMTVLTLTVGAKPPGPNAGFSPSLGF